MAIEPLYAPTNCKSAYELRWSLALFATTPLPAPIHWLSQLKEVVERDGVRILEHRYCEPTTHQFLVSTQPQVSPPAVVKSIKGRLQHLLHSTIPQAFRRNFSLTTVGDARRELIEAYVARQLDHHQMADDRVQNRLAKFQLTFPGIDLSQPQLSSHGRYLYNLHLVLVHDGRWANIDEARLAITRDVTIKAAVKKGHRLSRLAILPDHVHATLGCNYDQSPEQIALSYLNNLVYGHGMKPMYQFSYFVGTFGEYDLAAVRRAL